MSTKNDLHDRLQRLADEVKPVDLRDRALATSRRIGIRRTAVAVTATVLVLVAAVGATLALRPGRSGHSNVGPAQSATTTISATPNPSPSAAGQTPSIPPAAGTLVADPRTKTIVNAHIQMPAWPGLGGRCKGGTFSFHNGLAAIGNSGDRYVMAYEEPTSASADMPGVVLYANLDGKSSDEALISVGCLGDGSLDAVQLLAVRLMPNGAVTTLGNVIVPDGAKTLDFDPLSVEVSDRTVSVTVLGDHVSNGVPASPAQIRQYEFRGGGFVQTGGPTTFTTSPFDMNTGDIRNTSILFPVYNCGSDCFSGYEVRMVDGAGQVNTIWKRADGSYGLVPIAYTIRSNTPVTTGGTEFDALLVSVDTAGQRSEIACAASPVNAYVGCDRLATSGANGITAITAVAQSNGQIVVTEQTSSGTRTVRYTYMQYQWKPVN